ncbi:MAG: 4-alpha-glucanotransferase, partial [Candidatus Binatia bacterium]
MARPRALGRPALAPARCPRVGARLTIAARPTLARLALRLGILPRYVDTRGVTRVTPDRTAVALIAALGHDATSEASAARALATLDAAAANESIAPSRVAAPSTARRLPVALPMAFRNERNVEWSVEVRDEAGRRTRSGATRTRFGERGVVTLPTTLPHGYHHVRLRLERPRAAPVVADQTLIVVPPRCPLPRERIGTQGVFGLLANLYAVESARNWGAGDFGDLGTLVDFAGDIGAAFVGVNPLHALRNGRREMSPYSPVSRLY